MGYEYFMKKSLRLKIFAPLREKNDQETGIQ